MSRKVGTKKQRRQRRVRTLDPHMKRVVEGFVAWLARVEGRDARVTSWPDLEPNPTCDAVLLVDGELVEVEHTRVQHGEHERLVQSLLERVRPEIEKALAAEYPDRSTCIGIPFDGGEKPRLGSGFVSRLVGACSPAIARLAPKAYEMVEVPGLARPAVVERREVGVNPGRHLAFAIEPDEPAERRARKQVEEAVRNKAMKHGGPGAPMILLLDSELSPVPSMHVRAFAEAGLLAESRAFSELWLAGSVTDPVAFVGPVRPDVRSDPDALFRATVDSWDRMRRR